jgi:aminopeptidase YwaD
MPIHPDVLSQAVKNTLSRTAELIDLYGPRLAGSKNCELAAKDICADFARVCGNASLEPFLTHPGAFMNFYKINTVIFLCGLAGIYLNLAWLAVIAFTFILVGGFLEFGGYREFYDPLYPIKGCQNIIARLEPQGAVQQQLIISGHHDSAQILNLLHKHQKLYGLKIVVPDIIFFTALIFSWYWLFSSLLYGILPVFFISGKLFLTLGFFLILPKFFTADPHGTPGAGDNLVASIMLVELGRALVAREPGQPGKSFLDHTRLILVSFDAEESGLRGSRAFVKRHRRQLQSVPTYMLNIDSIYNVKHLQFLTSDLNGSLPLSKELAEDCQALAGRVGLASRLTRMVFGGGSTDAAELTRAGVQATTMLAMPTDLVRDGLVYHTVKDTVDAIEPEAVRACLEVAFRLVEKIDQKSLNS